MSGAGPFSVPLLISSSWPHAHIHTHLLTHTRSVDGLMDRRWSCRLSKTTTTKTTRNLPSSLSSSRCTQRHNTHRYVGSTCVYLRLSIKGTSLDGLAALLLSRKGTEEWMDGWRVGRTDGWEGGGLFVVSACSLAVCLSDGPLSFSVELDRVVDPRTLTHAMLCRLWQGN